MNSTNKNSRKTSLCANQKLHAIGGYSTINAASIHLSVASRAQWRRSKIKVMANAERLTKNNSLYAVKRASKVSGSKHKSQLGVSPQLVSCLANIWSEREGL